MNRVMSAPPNDRGDRFLNSKRAIRLCGRLFLEQIEYAFAFAPERFRSNVSDVGRNRTPYSKRSLSSRLKPAASLIAVSLSRATARPAVLNVRTTA